MFLGEFEYKIDENGRMPVPPRFRGELKQGAERSIVVYPSVEWKKLAATLSHPLRVNNVFR
ncbi:hypothetical protein ACFLUU_10220 [Chloroflexota bacterium]